MISRKRVLALILGAVFALGTVGHALAATPKGLRGYEGQPGNQGGHGGTSNGLKGYEGRPGNQGGH